MTVKFSGQEIKAHKAVLANRSKHFRTAFNGNFSVSNPHSAALLAIMQEADHGWKETHSREMNLGDNEDATVMRAMIRHLYYLPYDQMIDEKQEVNKGIAHEKGKSHLSMDLMFHVNVFKIADKYESPSLRVLVVENFIPLVKASWETPEFVSSVKAIWSPTSSSPADRSLQEAVKTLCGDRMPELIIRDDFTTMLKERDAFLGSFFACAFAYDHGDIPYKCQHCSGCSPEKAQHYCFVENEVVPDLSRTGVAVWVIPRKRTWVERRSQISGRRKSLRLMIHGSLSAINSICCSRMKTVRRAFGLIFSIRLNPS